MKIQRSEAEINRATQIYKAGKAVGDRRQRETGGPAAKTPDVCAKASHRRTRMESARRASDDGMRWFRVVMTTPDESYTMAVHARSASDAERDAAKSAEFDRRHTKFRTTPITEDQARKFGPDKTVPMDAFRQSSAQGMRGADPAGDDMRRSKTRSNDSDQWWSVLVTFDDVSKTKEKFTVRRAPSQDAAKRAVATRITSLHIDFPVRNMTARRISEKEGLQDRDWIYASAVKTPQEIQRLNRSSTHRPAPRPVTLSFAQALARGRSR